MESELNLVKYMTLDEAELNIWTLRITVTKDYTDYMADRSIKDVDAPIIEYLESLGKTIFPKILCYREESKSGKIHYHIRIGSTRWKTRKSLFDSIHKSFPFMKGQKCFSTKAVRVNGKKTSNLEKSITYISKERHRTFTRGYSTGDLDKFETIGSTWADMKKMPIFKQIIQRYDIRQSTGGTTVCMNVLNWYESEGRDAPTYFTLTKLLSNIKLEVDPEYRNLYLMRGAQYYDDMMHNLGN